MDDEALAFLSGPAARGMTVLVVGLADPRLTAALRSATGTTGLVILASLPGGAGSEGVSVRAVATAVPVRSHIADLVVLLLAGSRNEIDAVAEEVRRTLAPGGMLRVLAPVTTADRLLVELHAAAFRDATTQALGSEHGVRARGP